MGVPQICFRMDNHSFQRRIWGYPQFRKPLDPLDEKMMIQPKSRDFKTDYGEGTEPFLWRYTPWLAWVIGPQGLRSLDHKSWLPSLNVWGNSLCSVIPRLGEVVLLCFKLDDACISSGCSEVLRFWTQPILPDYFQNRRSKAFRKLPACNPSTNKNGLFWSITLHKQVTVKNPPELRRSTHRMPLGLGKDVFSEQNGSYVIWKSKKGTLILKSDLDKLDLSHILW